MNISCDNHALCIPASSHHLRVINAALRLSKALPLKRITAALTIYVKKWAWWVFWSFGWIHTARTVSCIQSGSSPKVSSTQRKPAPSSSAVSSSSCGSETRFSPAGRSGQVCLTVPFASVGWWIRSWEIHSQVQPAGAWSKASSSFETSLVMNTTGFLERGGVKGV